MSLILAETESSFERAWFELGPRLNRAWAERVRKARLERPANLDRIGADDVISSRRRKVAVFRVLTVFLPCLG